MKKILACILSLSVLGMYFPTQKAIAVDKTEQLYNIVFFAQYDSLDDHNFMETYSDEIVTMYNDTSTAMSLSGFMDTISYGQTNVTSCFPQMEDTLVIPYQLRGNSSSYTTPEQYAVEILQNVEVPQNILLDGNHDGIVDNITFIIDDDATNFDSPVWPKAFELYDMEINGVRVGKANIHNRKSLFENIVTGQNGVICHEFLHSLGYPDLYRNNRTGTPVGLWDIMASNSVFLQYPLAYKRATVSHWLDYQTVTESGTYTLLPASADNGNRLFVLKTPLSDTEFFCIEYRKQGARYSDEMDTKIYGSGLVVYRVNTEVNGNFKSEQDEIYVFRPQETGLNNGEGDLLHSNYGGDGAPSSIGSADFNADITDGAIVYSNGTNSGIVIDNIVMNDDTLTCDITFADTSSTKLWKFISTNELEDQLPYHILNKDNNIYLLSANDEKATVYQVENGTLSKFGVSLDTKKYTGMNQPSLVFANRTPYIVYHDYDFNILIDGWDNASDSWKEIYKGSDFSQYSDVTEYNGKLYLAYTTGSFPYALQVTEIDVTTGKSELIGENLCKNACNLSISAVNDTIVVGYRDLSDDSKPHIQVYHDNWSDICLNDNPCGSVKMTVSDDVLWIAPNGVKQNVYAYANEKITEYEIPESINGHAFSQVPVTYQGKLYLAVNTQSSDNLSLYESANDKWIAVGDTLASEVVNALSLASDSDGIYCSFYTTQGTSVLKYLSLSNESINVKGDVNADGVFNLADVVALQKWLIAVPDTILADWKAADLCEDERLDVFDLVIMKRELIQDSVSSDN